ncbi:MAG: 23S rRNA pseudouridine synthase [Parcubacteria bacterium C7867-005]|nr:MAG: 23S rRNA pseudouridine synthase [Parcubacteria bacterium C7867-005]
MFDLSDRIIFEDEDILALDKPSGIVVHGDGRTKESSVSEWFCSKYPEARGVGEMIRLEGGEIIDRSGVVHRLDRDTSGVLLLAKTQKGFEHLKNQFLKRIISKTYIAFVHGSLKDDHGTLNTSIGKSPTDFRKYSAGRGATGEMREAVTYYQVLKRDKDVTLVEAKPKTGRTHQIRVHFQSLQRPVVCDKLYGASKPALLGFNRLALHARKVEFKDFQGMVKSIKADYPEDFLKAFEAINYVPKDLP